MDLSIYEYNDANNDGFYDDDELIKSKAENILKKY